MTEKPLTDAERAELIAEIRHDMALVMRLAESMQEKLRRVDPPPHRHQHPPRSDDRCLDEQPKETE